MDRREFLQRASLSAAAVFLPSEAPTGTTLVDRPSIVVIMSDDQPFHTQPWMTQTNTLLGTNGLTFSNAYVPTPQCGPSRAAFLTGLYAHNTDVKSNSHTALRFKKFGLGRQTLAYHLSQQGYSCGLFGKFMNAYQETAGWIPPGWDYWVATVGQYGTVIKANVMGTVRRPRQADHSFVKPKEESDWLADRTLGFIQSRNGEPFFAFVTPTAPHDPYTPSDANAGTFANVAMPTRSNFNSFDPNKPKVVRDEPVRNFANMQSIWRGKMEELMDVDDAIAKICSAIDFETTYVFYMSDNGYMLGEHRLFAKARPYEESVKMPLLVRGPGVRQNETSNLLSTHLDVSAAILELGGLDPEELSVDGRSLTGPMFEPDETLLEWRDSLFFEQAGTGGLDRIEETWSATRTQDSLYIENQDGERELYDMASDPYQKTNVAPEADESTLMDYSLRVASMANTTGDTLRSQEV